MTVSEATILVVDDEPELLEIFSLWLGRSAKTVLKAPNGLEALKVLDREQVSVIISDIHMPVMDGLTLIRRMYEVGLRVPSIMFVSGFGDLDVRDFYAMGVEAMLPKPLSRQELLHALECSLKTREELWLEPSVKPMGDTLEVELGSLHSLSVGRGGCCFTFPRPLPEGHVAFRINFADTHREMKGQGLVRWYDAKEQKVGLEFCYLEPQCRSWLIPHVTANGGLSYIPRS